MKKLLLLLTLASTFMTPLAAQNIHADKNLSDSVSVGISRKPTVTGKERKPATDSLKVKKEKLSHRADSVLKRRGVQADSLQKVKKEKVDHKADSTLKVKKDKLSHKADSVLKNHGVKADSIQKVKKDKVSHQKDTTLKVKKDKVDHKADSTAKVKKDKLKNKVDSALVAAGAKADSILKVKKEKASHKGDTSLKVKKEKVDHKADSTLKVKKDKANHKADSLIKVKKQHPSDSADLDDDQDDQLPGTPKVKVSKAVISPNPLPAGTSGTLTLTGLPTNDIFTLTIMTSDGEPVLTQELTNGTVTFDPLPAGFYIYHVSGTQSGIVAKGRLFAE